ILREARKSIAERQAEVDEEERKRKEEQRKKQDEDSRAVKVENAELFQTSEEKEETAKRILIHGLNEKGTRWLAMRDTLIPYLKIIQGNDEEETAEMLRNWTKQEIARGKVDSSYDDCVKEIDTLIKSWYPKVNDFYAVIKEIEITRMEIDWVMSVIEKGGTRNARDLLWVLLILSKAYKERVDRVGTFYASRAKVQQLLSNPKRISPATIQKQRQWLA